MQSSRNQHQKDSNVQPSKSRKKEEKKGKKTTTLISSILGFLFDRQRRKTKPIFRVSIKEKKKIHCPIN